jgi:hexosaminidase
MNPNFFTRVAGGFRRVLLVMAALGAMRTVVAAGIERPAIVPLPREMVLSAGSFRLAPDARIYADAGSTGTAQYLAGQLAKATGYAFAISEKPAGDSMAGIQGGILLTTNNAEAKLGEEGYVLTVATNGVAIHARTQAGLFYGEQTLLQLLPTEIFSTNVVTKADWTAPCGRIEDWPQFRWRGLMLDVSRHFFSTQEVEALLEAMALHKLNTFQWHLADDQGWRIEIKKYPKLTGVGAWRSGIGFQLDPKSSTAYGADGRYGGFYTQDDIREVVAYAKKLHIMVVPEIEMPGHSAAALAAYPELSCSGRAQSTDIGGGVNGAVYCAGREETFEFLENVLAEVFALFPSPYIHIGGDEVPEDNWKKCPLDQARMKQEGLTNEEALEGYFIRRIETFANAQGRTVIGWSEIMRGGLGRSTVVMDWIGGGHEAAAEGHDVVMTPTSYCYLDYYQTADSRSEPRAGGGWLTLAQVYSLEPVPAKLAPGLQGHILGAQGNLWTEYVPNLKHAEYMIFPRLCALAEVAWSAKESRDFEDFRRRLKIHERRLEEGGINYRRGD